MAHPIVLSHVQTLPLLTYRDAIGCVVRVSPDLGLTTAEGVVEAEGVRLRRGLLLPWEALEAISASENNCFILEEGGLRKALAFSPLTNRVYGLMPTEKAPTMLVSGVPMHRIKGSDPYHDTVEKVGTVRPVTGRVLDTATGLGYTAIEAARTATHVTTIELDPTALEMARLNPWSRGLFDNPRIAQRIGDSCEVVWELADRAFDRIIHDPPAMALAGDLYAREFYRELYRVLQRGGRLFHYVGDPDSTSGRQITLGVIRRLQEAGFSRVMRRPRAFGLLALK